MTEKPIELIIKEMKENLVNIVNTSHLPHFVIAEIFNEVNSGVQKFSQVQTVNAIEKYEQDLANEQANTDIQTVTDKTIAEDC
jgi:hypothetical protein